jgi:hypothetical protein
VLRGALIPGLGQIYTGRPVLGAAVLAGVVSAVAVAIQERTVQRTLAFTTPEGRPYTQQVAVEERPYQAAGIAAGAAVWTIAALESSIYADRHRRERPRVLLRATGALLPGADGERRPGAVVGVRVVPGG